MLGVGTLRLISDVRRLTPSARLLSAIEAAPRPRARRQDPALAALARHTLRCPWHASCYGAPRPPDDPARPLPPGRVLVVVVRPPVAQPPERHSSRSLSGSPGGSRRRA